MLHVIEINKYRPSLMRRGRYLSEDWGSCSDISKTYNGIILTREEYLRVEASYISAVRAVCSLANVPGLCAHKVEHWDVNSETLRRNNLDDVIDGTPAPADGEPIAGPRIDNAFRRCLREVGWLEFVVPKSFVIHFGYDYRVLIGLAQDPSPLEGLMRDLGLFMYKITSTLSTFEEWGFA